VVWTTANASAGSTPTTVPFRNVAPSVSPSGMRPRKLTLNSARAEQADVERWGQLPQRGKLSLNQHLDAAPEGAAVDDRLCVCRGRSSRERTDVERVQHRIQSVDTENERAVLQSELRRQIRRGAA
jgi:hypothetical protein